MIQSKQELQEYLKVEAQIYNSSLWKGFILGRENDVLWRFVVLLRYTEFYLNTHHKFKSGLLKLFLFRMQNKYALHIPPNTCGKGISIAHVGPIVINTHARIGVDARLHVGCNIGANGDGGAPIIGDHVYVGPGAKIFGEIELADHVRIGANAVVNHSCMIENALLVGIPAIVKERRER